MRLYTTRAMSIVLNAHESKFISLLDTFAGRQKPPVVCRIAGGWVRDKLLNLPSDDLDIALTTPSGHAFALAFVDYLKGCDVPTTSVGKVAANPDQSKHLETGTTRILGLDCDFVGLRSETYADSRIPSEIRLGTPYEDATRRDLTINSLFYNVHDRKIEDQTGKGLDDLARKIARTPLPPRQTFHDDPLRVLRCVRFASRFDLAIAPDVSRAIQDPDVQTALRNKVSKERVGIEVSKMLGKRPVHSLELIETLRLHSSIFTCEIDPPRDDALRSALLLQRVAPHFGNDDPHDSLWFACALAPFRDATVKGKKDLPAVSVVIAQGLKLSTEIKNSVTNLFSAAKLLDPDLRQRSALGPVLQSSSVRPWQRSIVWATVMALLPIYTSRGWSDDCDRTVDRYVGLQRYILDSGLAVDIDKPPLMNGHELQQLLQIRPSPLLNVIRQAVNRWQLDNPSGDKYDCEGWVKAQWEGTGRLDWEAECPKPEKRKR